MIDFNEEYGLWTCSDSWTSFCVGTCFPFSWCVPRSAVAGSHGNLMWLFEGIDYFPRRLHVSYSCQLRVNTDFSVVFANTFIPAVPIAPVPGTAQCFTVAWFEFSCWLVMLTVFRVFVIYFSLRDCHLLFPFSSSIFFFLSLRCKLFVYFCLVFSP